MPPAGRAHEARPNPLHAAAPVALRNNKLRTSLKGKQAELERLRKQVGRAAGWLALQWLALCLLFNTSALRRRPWPHSPTDPCFAHVQSVILQADPRKREPKLRREMEAAMQRGHQKVAQLRCTALAALRLLVAMRPRLASAAAGAAASAGAEQAASPMAASPPPLQGLELAQLMAAQLDRMARLTALVGGQRFVLPPPLACRQHTASTPA